MVHTLGGHQHGGRPQHMDRQGAHTDIFIVITLHYIIII